MDNLVDQHGVYYKKFTDVPFAGEINGTMRVRTKDCYVCNYVKEVLYRCRYQELKD